VKLRLTLFFLSLLICFSCNKNSTKGIRCATGKTKKTKSYKVKKIKAYQRGYPVEGNGNAPQYSKREKQDAESVQSASVEETTLDTVPVDIDIQPIVPEKQTVQIDTPHDKRDTIRRTIVERIRKPNSPVSQFTEQYEQENSDSPRDTIRRQTLERRRLQTPHSEENIFVNDESNKRDTIRRRTVERRRLEPKQENEVLFAQEEQPDTIRRKTVIRQTNPNKVDGLKAKMSEGLKDDVNVEINYDPVSQFLFKNQVFEKDEDFEYEEIIPFVPNFEILLYPEEAKKTLDSLIVLLNKFPNKSVYVYGNGGFDDADEMSEVEIKYRKVFSGDNDFGFGEWSRAKNYFGRNRLVYEQNFFFLGNSDPHQLNRIKEEGLSERNPYEGYNIGELLLGRAITIEKLLIANGINKKRIKVRRGEFLPKPNPTVLIRVENQ